MTPENDVIWLRELDDRSAHEAGPKIARLGQLRRLGMRVPDGFAVSVNAFTRFFRETGLSARIDALLAAEASGGALGRVAAAILAMIAETKMPPAVSSAIDAAYNLLCLESKRANLPVAVRSSATGEDSATRSFAGQYVTHLGIHGGDRVVEAVKSCWASMFSEHALHYRAEHDVSYLQSPMAVGVLSLVKARSAGVAFSIHPVSGNRSRMVIEGSWGWGEAVVQGLVTPDHAELDSEDGRLLDYVTADKRIVSAVDPDGGRVIEQEMPPHLRHARVLDEDELAALFVAMKTIEGHYKVPIDVEWVVDESRRSGEPLTIVQTRPITTVGEVAPTRLDPLAYTMKYAMGRLRNPLSGNFYPVAVSALGFQLI